MARPARPWYRAARDAWFVFINGKCVKLVDGKSNKTEAYRRFLAIDPEEARTVVAKVTGEEVCDLFIRHAESHLRNSTATAYRNTLLPFASFVKKMDGNAVQPKDLSRYMDRHPNWNNTTRYNVITGVKRAWSWAKSEGHLTVNNLAEVKRPRPQRREEIPDDKEVQRLFDAAKPELREFLTFLNETGCRPGEAFIIERRHVDLTHREVRFKIGEDKTSGKTGRPRVIHLNDQALAILKKLIGSSEPGPLFRNSRGKPWNRNSVRCAINRIRVKSDLSVDMVAYALRHRWITDALARGVSIAMVAEMCGTSAEMVARVYSHLSDKKSLLLEAASRVRPSIDLSQ